MGGISSRVRVIPPARSQRDWKPVRLPSYRTVSDLAVWRGGDTLSAIGAMSIPSHDFHNTRRQHERETGTTITLQSHPVEFAGTPGTRYSEESVAQLGMVLQMAKTLSALRLGRSPQPLPPPASARAAIFAARAAAGGARLSRPAEAQGRLAWRSSRAGRTEEAAGVAAPAVAFHHQTHLASGGDPPAPSPPREGPLLPAPHADRALPDSSDGLDRALSGGRGESLRLSYDRAGHARLHADDPPGQDDGHRHRACPKSLENTGDSRGLADGQRRRLLRRLQSAAHVREIRAAVFVRGHRADLHSLWRSRAQRRGGRSASALGQSHLATSPLSLGGARPTVDAGI